MSRTLVTDKGLEVTTTLTDAEAHDIIAEAVAAGKVSDFAASLAADYRKFGRLTNNKLAWLHKYALAIVDKQLADDDSPVDLQPVRIRGPRTRRRYGY